jgi:hypothetical protein
VKRLLKFIQINCCVLLMMSCLVVVCVSGSAEAKGWRLPVGLTYVIGNSDVVDLYEKNLRASGYGVADNNWDFPVGISFNPYYEFGSGFRIGTGFGPMSIIMTTGADESFYFFNLPLNANIGFTFLPNSSVAPYIRGGVMYNLASGDYVDGTSPGLFGAVGIEFMRNRKVALGVEVAYDTSEIEFVKYYGNSSIEEIKPHEVMISIFASF